LTRPTNPHSKTERSGTGGISRARPAVACRAPVCNFAGNAVYAASISTASMCDTPHARHSKTYWIIKPSRSDEPHNSSAAWATRRPRRVITKMFVAHGGQRSLNRKCPRHLSRDVFGRVDKSLRLQDNRLFCCATKPKHRREVVNKGTRNLVNTWASPRVYAGRTVLCEGGNCSRLPRIEQPTLSGPGRMLV
jgi:hypothetical protein